MIITYLTCTLHVLHTRDASQSPIPEITRNMPKSGRVEDRYKRSLSFWKISGNSDNFGFAGNLRVFA